jgi:hypothetical protein
MTNWIRTKTDQIVSFTPTDDFTRPQQARWLRYHDTNLIPDKFFLLPGSFVIFPRCFAACNGYQNGIRDGTP